VAFSIEQDATGQAATPRDRPAPIAPPESAGRMIAIALGCIVLAFLGAFVGGLVMGLVVVAFRGFAQAAQLCLGGVCGRAQASTSSMLFIQAGALGTASVLFFSARARATTIGFGDRREGLGNVPVERLSVILALGAVIAAYAVLVSVASHRARPDQVSLMLSVSGWLTVTFLAIVVVVAPVAEELFFRGWLWVGLRGHWSAVPTAVLTGLLWDAIHIEGGIVRPLLLLPVALILSTARHFGESVRAPIALHALYNIIVLSPPWHLKWLGLI
jgi:membrane protease YdiL (CAAX protease family)